MAPISTAIPCKRSETDFHYQCLEPIILDITIGRTNIIITGLYRMPRQLVGAYQQLLEEELNHIQRAKKVVSDSPGLVDFAIGLVNSVLNLPDGQVKIFRRSKITEVL